MQTTRTKGNINHARQRRAYTKIEQLSNKKIGVQNKKKTENEKKHTGKIDTNSVYALDVANCRETRARKSKNACLHTE